MAHMTDGEYESKYPEQKPVCFNYMAARADILTLCAEKQRLEERLAAFEEGSYAGVTDQTSAL